MFKASDRSSYNGFNRKNLSGENNKILRILDIKIPQRQIL